MIKVLQLAIQTLFGWTVLTCGVPADDFLFGPPDGFSQIDYVCIIEVNGDKYGATGTFKKLDENKENEPFIIPKKSSSLGDLL